MAGYQGRSSNDTSGSIRNSFHLPEEYNVRGRGRSNNDHSELVPSRGRSLSMARNSRARSKSRQPAGERSAITQASSSVVSSRGRSASMAPSRRSSSRAPPPKVRASQSSVVGSVQETQVRPPRSEDKAHRSRSKSRARSKSRVRSKSTRRVEPADISALIPAQHHSDNFTDDKEATARRRSSRKFVVEIDEETNDIIGVKEVSDDEPLVSSGSGGSERSRESRGRDNARRTRSRSILRSSHGNSFTSQGERVKFALEDEAPLDTSRRSSYEENRRSLGFEEERGRSMQSNRNSSKSRSLSRQRINFNDVNFDPRCSGTSAHDNLMELLKRPDRPYEQCHSPKKGNVSQSNHTEDTTLTIEEEESDDDSFGYTPGSNTMKNVTEEAEEATVLSGCDSYANQTYHPPPPRIHHVHQNPLRHSMPAKTNPFKNKLKPVRSFNIRTKRQTAPLRGSRQSQDTEGTTMSTDDEYDRSHLFIDRAADSLMMHAQKNQYQEEEPRRKAKSRLSRFLHR